MDIGRGPPLREERIDNAAFDLAKVPVFTNEVILVVDPFAPKRTVVVVVMEAIQGLLRPAVLPRPHQRSGGAGHQLQSA